MKFVLDNIKQNALENVMCKIWVIFFSYIDGFGTALTQGLEVKGNQLATSIPENLQENMPHS